ncbi:MAG: YCF48-related protein [Syntrophales bacterium]|nr:YCF48-related protein [Syntrophales bacterium]
MVSRVTTAVLVVIGALTMFCTAATAGTADFQDPYKVPAVKSPLAEKTLLQGIARAGTRLVAVGWRGHILYSDDQGKSWTQTDAPVSSDLLAVSFPSPLMGWAVGHAGIVLHTTDGGVTWTKQLDGRAAGQIMTSYYAEHPPMNISEGSEEMEMFMMEVERFGTEGLENPFLDVWFESDTTGFIIGTFNSIFRTTDGGKSWEPWYDRTENPERNHLYMIRPVGDDLFISSERGLALKFDRQSGQFRRMDVPCIGSFFGHTGVSPVVILYGMVGNVFRSGDSGASWNKIETGMVATGVMGSTVTEDGRIVLVNGAGQVLISADGGENFKIIRADKPFPLTGVVEGGKGELVLTGFGGVQVQKVK